MADEFPEPKLRRLPRPWAIVDGELVESEDDLEWRARFRARLASFGTSIRDIAEKTGENRETVQRYLRGDSKPSAEFVRNFALAFSVSTDWLLGVRQQAAPHEGAKARVGRANMIE